MESQRSSWHHSGQGRAKLCQCPRKKEKASAIRTSRLGGTVPDPCPGRWRGPGAGIRSSTTQVGDHLPILRRAHSRPEHQHRPLLHFDRWSANAHTGRSHAAFTSTPPHVLPTASRTGAFAALAVSVPMRTANVAHLGCYVQARHKQAFGVKFPATIRDMRCDAAAGSIGVSSFPGLGPGRLVISELGDVQRAAASEWPLWARRGMSREDVATALGARQMAEGEPHNPESCEISNLSDAKTPMNGGPGPRAHWHHQWSLGATERGEIAVGLVARVVGRLDVNLRALSSSLQPQLPAWGGIDEAHHMCDCPGPTQNATQGRRAGGAERGSHFSPSKMTSSTRSECVPPKHPLISSFEFGTEVGTAFSAPRHLQSCKAGPRPLWRVLLFPYTAKPRNLHSVPVSTGSSSVHCVDTFLKLPNLLPYRLRLPIGPSRSLGPVLQRRIGCDVAGVAMPNGAVFRSLDTLASGRRETGWPGI
ncbi:hypothetical protein Purlil1_12570 [Purpureocillium lilacinum]|uniref:Uncharacterized protein n=1 Tax=Purpureocillium lilacinum TaxID=33203 RepID=A0ABR0BGI5_PURLI|nr:hypothetical protein Purlil1_12570 [Purpureocillium lilacinum]